MITLCLQTEYPDVHIGSSKRLLSDIFAYRFEDMLDKLGAVRLETMVDVVQKNKRSFRTVVKCNSASCKRTVNEVRQFSSLIGECTVLKGAFDVGLTVDNDVFIRKVTSVKQRVVRHRESL